MNLLNRQVGAVNFKPLEARFEEIFTASRTFLPANPELPPLVNYVRRTLKETDSRKVLPFIPGDLETISTTQLQAGKQSMQKNKLEDGVQIFRKILQTLIVSAVSSQAQVNEVSTISSIAFSPALTVRQAKELIQTAAQYVLAMSIELTRRELVGGTTDLSAFSEEDKKRALELSAYFTIPAIEPQHQTLALFTAMNFAHKNKQLSSALNFANALIEKGTNARFKENVSTPSSRVNHPINRLTIYHRQRKSRLFANVNLAMLLRSSMIHSASLTFAVHPTHQFTPANRA